MSTSTSTSTSTAAGERRELDASTAVRTGGAVALVAVVANVLVLLLARALGVDGVVEPPGGGEPAEVGVVMVVGATLTPLLLGTGVLAVAARWGRTAWRVLALAGLAAGLLTVGAPLTAAVETSTGVALALMHVLTGAAWALLVLRATGRGGAGSR